MAIDLQLPPGPRAPAEARRTLAERIGPLDGQVMSRLRLLVTELVSNSVRHAELGDRDWIRITARREPDRVRVAVSDPGRGFPGISTPPPRPPPDRVSGWGLFLVDRLADRWGIEETDHTRVWFELAC